MKLEKTFPRESYAKAMKEACVFSIKEKKRKGVYSYPNRYGINLEKMAGFKEYSFYVKRVSFVLFNNTFLLPIEIYQRRIHICKTFFIYIIFRRNLKLFPTRLSKFKLSILLSISLPLDPTIYFWLSFIVFAKKVVCFKLIMIFEGNTLNTSKLSKYLYSFKFSFI